MSTEILYSGEAWLMSVIGDPPRYAVVELDPDKTHRLPTGYRIACVLAIATERQSGTQHYVFPHWSNIAATMCSHEDFQRWLGTDDAEVAAEIVRDKLGIRSRAWLDQDDALVRAFIARFYAPFHSGEPFV